MSDFEKLDKALDEANLYPEKDAVDPKVYNSENTAEELIDAGTVPVLMFKRNVWEEIQYLTKKCAHSEYAVFLLLKKFSNVKPAYEAVAWYFPDQEASGGGVSIDGSDSREFFSHMAQREMFSDHTHTKIAHLHSHNSMACFWSQVDTNQQLSRDDLGYCDDFRFYAVVNTKDEIRACMVTYKPILHRYDNLPVVVEGEPYELSDERKAEIDAMAATLKPLSTSVFEGCSMQFSTAFTEDVSLINIPKKYKPLPVARTFGNGNSWREGYGNVGMHAGRWDPDEYYGEAERNWRDYPEYSRYPEYYADEHVSYDDTMRKRAQGEICRFAYSLYSDNRRWRMVELNARDRNLDTRLDRIDNCEELPMWFLTGLERLGFPTTAYGPGLYAAWSVALYITSDMTKNLNDVWEDLERLCDILESMYENGGVLYHTACRISRFAYTGNEYADDAEGEDDEDGTDNS